MWGMFIVCILITLAYITSTLNLFVYISHRQDFYGLYLRLLLMGVNFMWGGCIPAGVYMFFYNNIHVSLALSTIINDLITLFSAMVTLGTIL